MTLAVVVRPVGTGGVDPSVSRDLPEGTSVTVLDDGGALHEVLAALAPADVIVLDGTAVVPSGWTAALADAAAARTDIATVSASSVEGPRVVVAAPDSPVMLITRRALTVVGFRPGEGLDDFAQRSTDQGFTHVVAGDVVVPGSSPVAEAIGVLDRAIRTSASDVQGGGPSGGLAVGIDAELINASLTGTFEAGLAISLAVARQDGVSSVHWIAQSDRVEPLTQLLEAKGIDTISVATLEELRADGLRIDVAFRPYQDFLARTWPEISRYAHRNIVWTLDLIANVVPSYAKSDDDYHRLNRTSSQAWENADAIGVLTPHVGSMLEAYQGGLTDPRIFVLPAGSPEAAVADPGGNFEDERLADLADGQFVLVLGNNYLHKGRAWFIRVMRRVFEAGWNGSVVLVGPTPEFGNSSALEAAELPTAGGRVIVAGRVGGDDRDRLLSRATLTAAPSVTEGWGMTPAEALAHGSTPIASLGGGLRDITPPDALSLTMSNDDVDAATLLQLLTDSSAREAQRSAWQRGAEQFTWDGAAQILVEQMRATLAGPRHFVALVREEDIALDPVRALHWRILDRILPQGGAFRSAVARAVRRSA